MLEQSPRTDILAYILPLIPPSSLSTQNSSGSTPLHWATLNEQLGAMKALVAHPTGPGAKLVDIKNNAGRTALGEAEMAGWDAGAVWLVGAMDVNESKEDAQGLDEGELTGEAVGDADVEGTEPLEIHVEVQDAESGISRMTINADATLVPKGSRITPSTSSYTSPPT